VSTDVLSTRVADRIAIVTLGSPGRIYFDAEMGDALTAALDGYAGDLNIRAVILTGGALGYFARHFSIASLLQIAEPLRASGREWPDNATYNAGFFDKAMALCESMPKPVIAAISGTCLAGAFEFALSCDLRIAEDGDYLIGLPETNLGLLPGAGGTQRLPRTIGTALMHILMGDAVNPKEAARLGLVYESVSGKALDRAMEIARRLASRPPESVAAIKRLVRNATETPLAQGLALERNLFLRLCISDAGLARMRSYEAANITSPASSAPPSPASQGVARECGRGPISRLRLPMAVLLPTMYGQCPAISRDEPSAALSRNGFGGHRFKRENAPKRL
jgi:enoyl-CoA hydratase/carnithine racemase